ncbi:MAG TPA: sigma-70 family RNA polymerase sigma factor [Methylomirabilota bacterium]|nr:sigma-70 family RNA polymerase sigma factor [Methylomirabilota bacterium]
MRTRTNEEWLGALAHPGGEQAAALRDLRAYLVRAARYALQRTRSRAARPASFDVDHLAEDCAQNALMAILDRLGDFRGDSRFTTWAYKFAINMALVAGRREAWKAVSLDALLEQPGRSTWQLEADTRSGDPEQTARRAEAWKVVQEVIDTELSERQRQALKAIVVDEVPLDELVRHWGSNRNAVYKLLHDARWKLKARLAARGFAPGDVLGLFGGPR